VVSDELASVAKRFADPRRTVLLEGTGVTRSAAVPLEVTDDPCLVLLSSTGLIARTPIAGPGDAPGDQGVLAAEAGESRAGPRAAHDVIAATVSTTARGTIGVVTSLGRFIRLGVLDIPALPPSAHSPSLAGGAPMSEFVSLASGETVVGLAADGAAGGGLALGTAEGVVKRVTADYPGSATEFEVIGLKEGDQVVRAVQLASEEQDLVFITSDAQLLHFPAASVRPQGRPAGGMAGIRLSARARVIWFGAVPADGPGSAGDDSEYAAVVVTVAGTSGTLPGTGATTVKVTPYREYPAKGRATGGVRCHRFLKGEDALVLAWASIGPARGASAAGVPMYLPDPEGRRDGSGERARQALAALGGLAPPA
jgi:DNA gyrase subunit A